MHHQAQPRVHHNRPFILERQLKRLETLLGSASRAELLTKDVDFQTSEKGLVFVVEKPGKWPESRLLDLRSNVTDGRLPLTNLGPTGHASLKQFGTQFPGCYLVVKTSRRERFNFVPFDT